MYFYEFVVGTAYFSRWGLDDRKARRLLARWLRLAWFKYRAKHPRGSMAQAIDDGWDGAPQAQIARTWVPGSVVPCKRRTLIESFRADEMGIGEFCGAYENTHLRNKIPANIQPGA